MDKKILDDLKQLSAAYATLQKEAKGLMDDMPLKEDEMKKRMSLIYERMYEMNNNVHSRLDMVISSFNEWIGRHEGNHLPRLSPSQMEKLLKNAGASEDFEIKRPTLYMSNASRDIIEAELKFEK